MTTTQHTLLLTIGGLALTVGGLGLWALAAAEAPLALRRSLVCWKSESLAECQLKRCGEGTARHM